MYPSTTGPSGQIQPPSAYEEPVWVTPIEGSAAELPKSPDEIVSGFLMRQVSYSDRNVRIAERKSLFEGQHWASSPEDDSSYQLVLNYTRNVVLRFIAILARAPKPRIPSPPGAFRQQANRREQYLRILWPDLMRAWRDVETNASKVGFGVLQVVWSPPGPIDRVSGMGMDTTSYPAYVDNPFKFRSIEPKNFYPVFRTFDHSNDLQEVYRFDPARLIDDLHERYGVKLQTTGLDEPGSGPQVGTEPTADLIEWWSKTHYALIAMTRVLVEKRPPGAGSRPPRSTDYAYEYRYAVLEAGPNPYAPDIPFFVLQNIRSDPDEDPTDLGSMADLDDIESLNRHINEILSEEAEEIIVNIHRPNVYKSADHLQEPETLRFEPGAVYPIGDEEQLDTLDWRGEPAIVPNHVDRIQSVIKDLTFLGDAGFGQIAAGMTGIGFQIALTPLQQIVELKVPLRQELLQQVARFLFRCYERKAGDVPLVGWLQDQYGQFGEVVIAPEDISRNYFAYIDYGNLLPRDDLTHQQNEVYKYKTGVQSLFTTLEKMGFEDPDQEMARLKEELQDVILNPQHAALIRELGGAAPSGPGPVPPGAPQPAAMGPMGGAAPGLPGTAQIGTRPVQPMGMGGFPGTISPGPAPTQPPVPTTLAAPRGAEGGAGPGQIAPFIGRGGPGA